MPRSKKSPEHKQDHVIKLSLTAASYHGLVERAAAAELPLATYCAKVLAKARSPQPVPEVNRELYNQFLRDIGKPLTNLSQILQVLNTAQKGGAVIPSKLLQLLEAEIGEIKTIRLRLITDKEEGISTE